MKKLLLFTIVVLGLYLRVRAAWLQSFWGDESSIFTVSMRNSLKSLILVEHWDKCHPQLFYVFLHFWQKISTNILFLRIPTLVAFIPTIFFIYKIGKQTGGWLMGILSSIFFATNHFFVNLGFQQKMYAFEMVFMFGTIYWMQMTLTAKSKKSQLLFIVFAVLGFYTDYSFVWLWASVWLTAIILYITQSIQKTALRKFFKSLFIATLFMLPQVPIVLRSLTAALGLEAYSGIPIYETVRYAIANYAGLINLLPYDLILIIIISVSALFLTIKSQQKNAIILTLISLLCFYVTLTTSYFISQTHPIFIPRNLLVSSFLFIFLVPYVISQSKNQYLKIILIVIFFLHIARILQISLKLKDGFQGLDQWSEIHETAKKINGPFTLVIISDKEYALDALHEYYFDGYYDGTKITKFNEQWIKIKEVDNWIMPQSMQYANNIIFISDPDQIKNKSDEISKISAQICQNRMCYGPFTLQGAYKSP